MSVMRLLPLLVLALVSGCANFRSASDFASHTQELTGAVKAEFSQLETLCTQQAELVIVVNRITDEGPLSDCQGHKAAQGRLARVTVDVLDAYAHALASLADAKALDLSPEAGRLGAQVRALKDRSGRALVGDAEATALTRIADLLLAVATEQKRDDAIHRLVDATPDLRVTGLLLRRYFVADGKATVSPYANLVQLSSDSFASTRAQLEGPALRGAEPIRSAELLRDLRRRRVLLDKRGTDAGSVPAQMAAAIDAWLESLDAFAADALKPDARTLLLRLRLLREKMSAARRAVEGD